MTPSSREKNTLIKIIEYCNLFIACRLYSYVPKLKVLVNINSELVLYFSSSWLSG